MIASVSMSCRLASSLISAKNKQTRVQLTAFAVHPGPHEYFWDLYYLKRDVLIDKIFSENALDAVMHFAAVALCGGKLSWASCVSVLIWDQ